MAVSKQRENLSSLRRTVGIIAALFGLSSGFLYQYHEAVVIYRPDDITNTFGLYALCASVLFWCAFLVISFVIRNK